MLNAIVDDSVQICQHLVTLLSFHAAKRQTIAPVAL
jgi:hypothetical protein